MQIYCSIVIFTVHILKGIHIVYYVNNNLEIVKPMTKINNQWDIQLGQFTQREPDTVLTKIKNRKAAGLDENTTRSMEDKEIRQPTAPIVEHYI